jgi:peptidoglycan/xylan/chitin deacetylase (PgdA/CDA1 family)
MLKKLATATAGMLLALMPLTAIQVQAAVGPNLITNPTVDTDTTGWLQSEWKANEADVNVSSFTHDTTGHTGRSLKVETTTYASGAANWYHSPIAVSPNTTYTYSQWYKSNVATQVDVQAMDATGVIVSNTPVANAAASPDNWTQVTAQFTVPANVTSVIFYQPLAAVGYVQIDDVSLGAGIADPGTGTTFARPMVSVTFDDGWSNQHTNAGPILKANGINATFYLISNEVNTTTDGAYMTTDQAKALYADGHELASHTVNHCSLTNSTTDDGLAGCEGDTDVTYQLQHSKADLAQKTGAPITNFAYPFGEYNDASVATGVAAGYTSQRTIEQGLNTKTNLNLNKLLGYEVDANTSVATVKQWIDNAIAQKAWVVLFYHEIAEAPTYPGTDQYVVSTANFTEVMQYIKSRSADIDSKTVAQAIATINGTAVTPPVTKPGDVNGDNVVDALDLSTLLSNWNQAGKTVAQGNLNGDITVDALDLSTLLANWSK